MNTPFFRINNQIQAKQVRLLNTDGTQIGIVSKEDALAHAHTANTDVVEIAPNANPPVVKLVDYKKFKYQLAKKEQAAKAAAKKVDLKEVRFTPFMAENDFQIRLNRSRGFISEGHKVRLNVRFVGRQLGHKEFGDQIMQKAFTALADIASVDQTPKWVGRQYMATITPLKK